jgi:transcriptional antiterminator Rof (Rho-off)
MKRRFIVASTGTILCQEYQPISCAWKTVLFLKDGDTVKAQAWVEEKTEKKSYQVVDTRTETVVARAESEEEANKKKRSLTRAALRTDARKGIYVVRVTPSLTGKERK